MKIVFASHTPIGDRFVVGSHHLARAFAAMGHDVLHLAPPDSPLEYGMTGDFRWMARLQAARREPAQIDRGLYQLQGVSLLSIKSSLMLNSCAGTLSLTIPSPAHNIARLGFEAVDILFVDHPSWCGIWKWIKARTTVYRPTDLYAECPLGYRFPKMGLGGRIRSLETQLLARCAMAICTSQPVAAHVQSITNGDFPVEVVENGVDYAHFAKRQPLPEEYLKIPSPRAVYVGSLDSRFDMTAVVSAARRLPYIHFVLVGPRPKAIHETLSPNIHLLGARDFSQVPAYLQHADVGLLPLKTSTANSGRSPMKYYEYLAAGLPIVASATAELRRRPNPFVRFYEGSGRLSGAMRRTLALSVDRAEVSQLAKPFAWSHRADSILEIVTGCKLPARQPMADTVNA